jgi:hypothetical protein
MLICGTEKCPCVRKKCERYGKCEECIEHHKTHKKYPLPYCQRKAAKAEEETARSAERASRTTERSTRRARKTDENQSE